MTQILGLGPLLVIILAMSVLVGIGVGWIGRKYLRGRRF
jgi:hypothetical protein